MKTKKVLLGLIFFGALLGSCKKQDLRSQITTQSDSQTKSAKAWVENQDANSGYQKFQVDGKVINVPQRILWDQTISYADVQANITPIRVESITGNLSLKKYLVTEVNEAGGIKNGNYYVVLSKNQGETPTVTPDYISLKNVPVDFAGSIIKYDIYGNAISSKHYEDGVVTGKTDKIVIKKSKNQIPVENNAPLDEGCSYVTIDWYWQTWENGVLVSEEYLFSSQEIVCEGGGSGGGGGTPPTDLEMCQIAVENILNATNPSSQFLSSEIESETPLTRTRLYSWKCVQNVGWWVVAYDKGVQKRIATNKPWTWLSLDNLSISKQGTTVAYGGQVTATKVTSQAVLGTYNSVMYLVVNISTTVSKNGISVTDGRDITSHFTYNVDTTPIPGF